MRKIIKMIQGSQPEFRKLSLFDIPGQLRNQYASPVFYTPHYQKIPFTQDFLRYMRYLRRKEKINNQDLHTFSQNLVTEYSIIFKQDRPQFQLSMTKQFDIPDNQSCNYHGKVDWIFKVSDAKFTPIMFFNSSINPAAGIAMALSNMYLRKQFQPDKNVVNGYSIVTTGQEWQLFRVDSNLNLKKTIILEGTKDTFRSIYHDEEIVATVMGMLEYSLEIPPENVQVLTRAYTYLDEKKYMIQAQTPEQAKKMSLVSRLLLEYYKRKT